MVSSQKAKKEFTTFEIMELTTD